MYIDSRRQSSTFQICIYTKIYIHLSLAKATRWIQSSVSPDCVPESRVHLPGGRFRDTKHATSKKKRYPWIRTLLGGPYFLGERWPFGGVSPLRFAMICWDAKSCPTGEITRQPGEHPKQWWCYWWALLIWKIRRGRDDSLEWLDFVGDLFGSKIACSFLLKIKTAAPRNPAKNHESWEFWSCPEMRTDMVGCDQSSHHGLWACPGVQSSWNLTPPTRSPPEFIFF